MASFSDLQDKITVTVNNPKVTIPTHPAFQPIADDIQRRLSKLTHLKTTVGSRVANQARLNQMTAINELDAICSGSLYGSIRVQGGGGRYTVGTTHTKKGYLYAHEGRPAIDNRPRGHRMVYPYKCYGNIIGTWTVGAAKPKPWMRVSKPYTEADITRIVQEEVDNAMS